jgi:outer membrane receptor protein involved in Fe transport
LKYVNTDLATLTGFDAYLECMPQRLLTPFVLMRYVDGRDRTRNGDFATRQGQAGMESIRVDGLPRGAFSFVSGSDSEPLPGIAPLETRVGVRLHEVARQPRWNVELAARIVDNQDRVATSLFESTTPGFTVWDLRSAYVPASIKGLTLVAGIENFTDKTYREHLDFRSFTGVSLLQPGINTYAGLDWQY